MDARIMRILAGLIFALGFSLLVWRVCCTIGCGRLLADHTRPTLPAGRFRRTPGGAISPDASTSSSSSHLRVLCMVVTSPQHHEGRARHVRATWANEEDPNACPATLYLTSATHPELPRVIISNYSSYDELWGKVLEGFRALDSSRADWFLKTDDDTFVIYRHLVNLLAGLNASQPLYLGLPYQFDLLDGRLVDYMSGGAGYLLSKTALRRLQKTTLQECHYPGPTIFEDVNMGACMNALDVEIVDTRDQLGRPRFLPYPPWLLIDPASKHDPKYSWLKLRSKYPFEFGVQHLSDRVISFHEVRNPVQFYLLQYLSQEVNLLLPGMAAPFTALSHHP
ncbi:glycoprotein-N-acetylgalactosamine 3-beta-galactosyltransferase 1-like isoform X2 [Panulirus ornatus]|uniref:glycoprotein-N-acetylgalactosamine 3-beta-galactosyltransferase 1-like isoform X2 n=1 Tax=Panulirus ornatus TaxID=150431 RepID=UPI003A84FE9A